MIQVGQLSRNCNLPSFCLFLFSVFLSTFLSHSPEPYYSDGQKLWLGPIVSCCSCSWSRLECCFWLTVSKQITVQCWTLPLRVWPSPRASFRISVCLLRLCNKYFKSTSEIIEQNMKYQLGTIVESSVKRYKFKISLCWHCHIEVNCDSWIYP